MTSSPIELLITTLSPRSDITSQDLDLLTSLEFRTTVYPRNSEIILQDSEVSESCLILSGWTGRAVFLENGKRQITAWHVAGDFVDLHGLTLKYMDHSVLALTNAEVAFVNHQELRRISRESAHLTRLLWMLTTIDAAIQRATIASLGRRQAVERLGHLLCEMDCRLSAIGLARDHSFEVPLSQEQLSDILGLSSVHMNRSVQEIRQLGFLTWQGHHVTINDFDKLAKFCSFDGRYLNLVKRER